MNQELANSPEGWDELLCWYKLCYILSKWMDLPQRHGLPAPNLSQSLEWQMVSKIRQKKTSQPGKRKVNQEVAAANSLIIGKL